MPDDANLYADRIDLAAYLTPAECGAGGTCTPDELAAGLKAGTIRVEDCPGLSPGKSYALSLALRAGNIMPAVPMLTMPRPVPTDLIELNNPGPDSPLLVTGNSEITLAVMTGVLSTTVSPLYLLLVDCNGDTVDMAKVLHSFTGERLKKAMEDHAVASKVGHCSMIVSGWLEPYLEELAGAVGWDIEVGPVCAAELPLYLGDKWKPPGEPGAQ
ncbi:MAG: hypothetical protein ABIJ56_15395 [Pseudomonadota bacterium]